VTTNQAVRHFGGKKELAAALGIWPHNIARWGRRPPLKRQYEIEIMTDGALKADRDEIKETGK